MLNEFKAFIARGNVMDLAVGVIIGAAFGSIVTSLVDDIINPLIGLAVGGLDFSALSVGVGDAQIKYGSFITAVIKFIIIAWVIFLMVKAINRMLPKKEAPPAPPPGPTEVELLSQIRDELAKR